MSNEETVKDSKGREIAVREVVGSRMARIARMAGDAFGENMWTSATMARASVVSIAGVPVPQDVRSVADLDNLWDQVDADAASAALDWLMAKQKKTEQEAKKSSSPEESGIVSGS
ncbi:hypothetical protein [Acetobacter sicerae]|uniref:hypothetical protein n=1 Tax=Acetobacter sicerae TaxID=85325 RepID=UPI00156AB6D2|nr:hypothetical protein [Acetobacter sicerae]NHN93637.1 hypothetical protein [Acetobacter sicerae]